MASPAVGDGQRMRPAERSTGTPTSGGWPATWWRRVDRRDGSGRTPKRVRFVEVLMNGPMTWSLDAALHPEIAEAYDADQERAAEEIVG